MGIEIPKAYETHALFSCFFSLLFLFESVVNIFVFLSQNWIKPLQHYIASNEVLNSFLMNWFDLSENITLEQIAWARAVNSVRILK